MREKNYFMSQIEKESLLTVEEEKELGKKAFAGDNAARNRLVTANLRFVIKIAGKYRNQGLDFEDLISEGTDGLIIAASKFNPEKNNRFITYAVWWIRQSIQKALYETGRDVKIPQNRKEEFKSSRWNMASLDAVYGDDENGDTLGNTITDSRSRTPEEAFLRKEEVLAVTKGIDSLKPKEKLVIKMRYGLDCEEKSLADIGKVLDFSKEGVRQIEKKALIKLQNELCSGISA